MDECTIAINTLELFVGVVSGLGLGTGLLLLGYGILNWGLRRKERDDAKL